MNGGGPENERLDELIHRLQIVLGRVAALRGQLGDIQGDLTEFESAAETPIEGDDFFLNVSDGDLVSMRDEQVPDGIADKVEFED